MRDCATCLDTGRIEYHCQMCDGSGEGLTDGSVCSWCRGKGAILGPCPDCAGDLDYYDWF